MAAPTVGSLTPWVTDTSAAATAGSSAAKLPPLGTEGKVSWLPPVETVRPAGDWTAQRPPISALPTARLAPANVSLATTLLVVWVALWALAAVAAPAVSPAVTRKVQVAATTPRAATRRREGFVTIVEGVTM